MSVTNTATLLGDVTAPLHDWLLSLGAIGLILWTCLLYTSPSPRDS